MPLVHRASNGAEPPKKMRVGIVTTSFPQPGNPESGAFVARLVEHLPRSIAAEVVLPCGSARGMLTSTGAYVARCFRYAPWRWQIIAHQPGGLPEAMAHPTKRFLLVPFGMALLVACADLARRVDVIHANWAATGAIVSLIAGLFGRPVLTTLRGADVSSAEKSSLGRRVLAFCFARSRVAVFVGWDLARRAADLLGVPASELTVIPNGIAPGFFREKGTPFLGRMEIIAVGSLIPRKDYATLLAAVAQLPETARLTLVGGGPEASNLGALAKSLGISERVRFLGAVAPAEIPALLHESHVLVLASIAEGRPNSVLEGMAAGLAVVASNIPGCCELIRHGENGLLFALGKPVALADCLRQLMEEPALLSRLGNCAQESVRHLTWHNTAEAYGRLYEALAKDAN
jgi:glycosyltransferase involved in cell wall biosynthesis